ncbi:MAG: hypothetical protein D6753_11260 [Planctomycetota bacterium]|nr:MAG: hypothetical protein D6753_11260 [Planctomycetota bacterium]
MNRSTHSRSLGKVLFALMTASLPMMLCWDTSAARAQGGFPPNGAWVYGSRPYFSSNSSTSTSVHIASIPAGHHNHFLHHGYHWHHYRGIGVVPWWYTSGISIHYSPSRWYYRVRYVPVQPWCVAPIFVTAQPPRMAGPLPLVAQTNNAGAGQPLPARPSAAAALLQQGQPANNTPPATSISPSPVSTNQPIASSRSASDATRPRYIQTKPTGDRTTLRIEVPDIDRSAHLELPPFLGTDPPEPSTPDQPDLSPSAEELPAPTPTEVPIDLMVTADQILAAGGYRQAATAYAQLSLRYGDRPELLLRRFVAQALAGEWESAEVVVSVADAWSTPLIRAAQQANVEPVIAIVQESQPETVAEAMAARALTRPEDPLALKTLAVWLWITGDRSRSKLFLQRAEQLEHPASPAASRPPVP